MRVVFFTSFQKILRNDDRYVIGTSEIFRDNRKLRRTVLIIITVYTIVKNWWISFTNDFFSRTFTLLDVLDLS